MQVQIFYSNRKTISLIITNNADLRIRAPIGTSKKFINTIVEKKQRWIKSKIDEIQLSKQSSKINFQESGKLYYLGKILNFLVINATENRFTVSDQTLIIYRKKQSDIKKILIDWYKKQAYEVIFQRCTFYADFLQCTFNSITITSAKKRLGSCDSIGNLRFSFYNALLDKNYIDYVVIHELSHRFFLDHSKAFWDKVRSIMPDFKQKRLWLKKNFYIIANSL